MPRRVIFFLIHLVMRLITQITVAGQENIPASGGAIIALNHLGRLDVPLVLVTANRPDLNGWVANKYRIPILYTLVELLEGIWLNRDGVDRRALRKAQEYLSKGIILGIAPEGTRSLAGELLEGKQGVAYLAAKTGMPIIPTGLHGPETGQKEFLRLRRPQLTITYGKPIHLPPLERATRDKNLQSGTDEIMCQIAVLLPDKYHGFYAKHPRLQELLRAIQKE